MVNNHGAKVQRINETNKKISKYLYILIQK